MAVTTHPKPTFISETNKPETKEFQTKQGDVRGNIASPVKDKTQDVLQAVLLKAQQGDTYAQLYLGSELQQGRIQTNNSRFIIKYLQALANEDNPKAQTILATLYMQGKGVEQNLQQAFNLYLSASELGHPEGDYNLGVCFKFGYAVQPNLLKAKEYIKKAAESKGPADLVDCAKKQLQNFESDQKQLVENKQHQEQVIEKFCLDLRTKALQMLNTQNPHYPKIYQLLHLANAQGDLESCYLIGSLHAANYFDPFFNPSICNDFHLEAAKKGYAKAQFKMGCRYIEGRGYPIDPKKAEYFFRLAAAQGHHLAQSTLAEMYRLGVRVNTSSGQIVDVIKRNGQRAIYWEQEASRTKPYNAQSQGVQITKPVFVKQHPPLLFKERSYLLPMPLPQYQNSKLAVETQGGSRPQGIDPKKFSVYQKGKPGLRINV